MGHQRPLHRWPRHPMRGHDLRLGTPGLDRLGQRHPQPARRRHPAGTCATCSVNVCRGHSTVRHRQRRLRHCIDTDPPPQGRSRGRVSAHSFPEVDTTPQAGSARRLDHWSPTPRSAPRPQSARHTPRQPVQPQQTRRIIATVNHGPWLSSRCSRTRR